MTRLAFVVALAVTGVLHAQDGASNGPTIPAGVTVAAEVIADIQVHGNNVTPEADVRALAGLSVGSAFTSDVLDAVRRKLLASGRFGGVEVRKRFASVADASQISIVIVVNEHPVKVLPATKGGDEPAGSSARIVKRNVLGTAMFMPLLDYEDGYGLTYGAVVAYPKIGGDRARLSFPLTWGGRKRAAVEYERPFDSGPVGRVRGGTAIERRTNPAFEIDDDRTRVWGRVESRVKWNVSGGVTSAIERVSFDGTSEVWRSVALDATIDTRLDPVFPRNAFFASASRTHQRSDAFGVRNRSHVDVQGFAGLIGSPVLMLRLESDTTDGPLPPYFKPLLGGWTSVRGFPAGAFAADNRLVTSLEIRVPVSSPLSSARTGFSVFVDRGKAYDFGLASREVSWRTGYGAGVWASVAFARAGVSVAHSNDGHTRVTAGVTIAR